MSTANLTVLQDTKSTKGTRSNTKAVRDTIRRSIFPDGLRVLRVCFMRFVTRNPESFAVDTTAHAPTVVSAKADVAA